MAAPGALEALRALRSVVVTGGSARASARSGVVEGRPVDMGLRCERCGRRLAEYAAAPYAFKCPRCKAEVKSAALTAPLPLT